MEQYALQVPNGTGTARKVEAGEVREGDFLLGLDNGYVVEVEDEHYYDDTRVRITFHDAEGNENELVVNTNVPILIARSED